jgi:hypothetical protein
MLLKLKIPLFWHLRTIFPHPMGTDPLPQILEKNTAQAKLLKVAYTL